VSCPKVWRTGFQETRVDCFKSEASSYLIQWISLRWEIGFEPKLSEDLFPTIPVSTGFPIHLQVVQLTFKSIKQQIYLAKIPKTHGMLRTCHFLFLWGFFCFHLQIPQKNHQKNGTLGLRPPQKSRNPSPQHSMAANRQQRICVSEDFFRATDLCTPSLGEASHVSSFHGL